MILTRHLPDQILFGQEHKSTTDRVDQARAARLEGITALAEAARLWEALSPNDGRQEAERRRCRREYVRALYNAGHANFDLIINDWDPAVFGLRLREEIPESANLGYRPSDLENARQAEHWFSACWLADRVHVSPSQTPNEAGIQAALGGVVDGVYKLYWLGKTAFAQYWILSSYGQLETGDAVSHRDTAEQYLSMALECPWPTEHARMRKDFIAELLARVYISQSRYMEAIQTIEAHRVGPHLEPYVAHTLALALLLVGRYAEAEKILQDAATKRTNKAVWTSWLLRGCNALSQGQWDRARDAFHTADREDRKHGKQTIDSILIGQAFASYKLHRRAEALDYLGQAVELNQYRWAAVRRLKLWRERALNPT
jgi:tetratricopeptide (TPR) repeat protein